MLQSGLNLFLSLIWMGFLGLRFEVPGGIKLPRLKLFRIMLELQKLLRLQIWHVSTHPHVVSEKISFTT